MEDDATLYAVVRFGNDQGRPVNLVILAFPSAGAADGFGLHQGYGKYTVAPIAFVPSLVWPAAEADAIVGPADPDGPTSPAIVLLDGAGGIVGTFDDWEAAHDTAHARAGEADVTLPLFVEDHRRRSTLTVHSRTDCQLTAWRIADEFRYCNRPAERAA
jgi:hypothetical protein